MKAELVAKVLKVPQDRVEKVWYLLTKEFARRGILKDSVLAVAAATIQTECGTWLPITERGSHDYFRRYDNRADLGNVELDDGFRFRGRGILQITGRSNYRKYGKLIGIPLEDNPDMALHPEWSVRIFCEYFIDHGIAVWAQRWASSGDENDLKKCRRLVNGGLNGYDRFKHAAEALMAAVEPPPIQSIVVDIDSTVAVDPAVLEKGGLIGPIVSLADPICSSRAPVIIEEPPTKKTKKRKKKDAVDSKVSPEAPQGEGLPDDSSAS